MTIRGRARVRPGLASRQAACGRRAGEARAAARSGRSRRRQKLARWLLRSTRMRMAIRVSVVSIVLLLLGACSAPSTASPCSSLQTTCFRGGPCFCDDQLENSVCQDATGACPSGYTRYQDCRGVPPEASCRGNSGVDASPSCPGSPPQCLRGGPCSCDDQAGNNGAPVCTGGVWGCSAGYTRFEDCRGVPPGPSCFADAATGD